MGTKFGSYGPALPRFGRAVFHACHALYGAAFATQKFYRVTSGYGRERLASMRQKLDRGEPVYLMGIGPRGHNSGVALIEATQRHGIRIIANDEEERFSGKKHDTNYPEHSLESMKRRLAKLGLVPKDLHAVLATWAYMDYLAFGFQSVAETFPFSLPLLIPSAAGEFNYVHALQSIRTPHRLGRDLGLGGAQPMIGMRHHNNHAYFSYGVSPFNNSDEPVMVTVLDAYGDVSAISLYLAQKNTLECVYSNRSMFDSLGIIYSLLSSTQGGWTPLSSEGRYMGAAAWGDNDRLTNPYYQRLRQLVFFADEGRVFLNRDMVDWHKWGEVKPYRRELADVIGKPIPRDEMWNPDAVLNVDQVEHSAVTKDRVDKAAATQLLFEDVIFHIVGHFIRKTGADKLVMCGGTALNCVANMHLLERFDASFYKRTFGRNTRLKLWVPPTPGDAGVPLGAAYQFAMLGGAEAKERLTHAFYCGEPTPAADIKAACASADEIGSMHVGNVKTAKGRQLVADLAAYIVSKDGILGFFHGVAETGPRALGHRSIVANPVNPLTLENINHLVKLREKVRPLAPMATLEAAKKYFELSDGAASDEFNAYNYMVLTARAKPEAYSAIPAVVHKDGTSRVQVVREEIDPFTHAYLKAMGRRAGVECSVNTSLNVGSPIVQTPEQALGALKRSRGLTGLLMIADDGDAFVAWHTVERAPKDAGKVLLRLIAEWQKEAAEAVAKEGDTTR